MSPRFHLAPSFLVRSLTVASVASVVSLASVVGGGPALAQASKRWDKVSSRCTAAFSGPAKATADELETCADTFNAYALGRDITSLNRGDIEKGMRWLYEKGAMRASMIGRDGLFRLGIKLPIRGDAPLSTGGATARPTRERYDPPYASHSDKRAAEALAKKGVALLGRKKYGKGALALEGAVAKDPRSEFALYNLGCGYALQDKRSDALTQLQHLADLGTDEGLERLIKARSDRDFEPMRDDPDFKRITGYMRIHVINTIGRPGEAAIANIYELLEKLGHAEVDRDKNGDRLEAPEVHFKPHTKAQVALIGDLLNHPRVRLEPMKGDSRYDLVIRWGARIESVDGKPQAESSGPEVVDDKMNAAKRKQNEILAKPEGAINKVDKVVSTPERTYNTAESMGKRAEGTFNKGKGVIDKVTGIGDKINSL